METFICKMTQKDDKDYSVKGMRCPKCGGKVSIRHNVVDGADFGFSIGCDRYYHYDGIHGTTSKTPDSDTYSIFLLDSKEECIAEWNKRVKHLEELLKKEEE